MLLEINYEKVYLIQHHMNNIYLCECMCMCMWERQREIKINLFNYRNVDDFQ